MFSGEGVGAAESPGSVGRPPYHVKTFYSGFVKTFTGPSFSPLILLDNALSGPYSYVGY